MFIPDITSYSIFDLIINVKTTYIKNWLLKNSGRGESKRPLVFTVKIDYRIVFLIFRIFELTWKKANGL